MEKESLESELGSIKQQLTESRQLVNIYQRNIANLQQAIFRTKQKIEMRWRAGTRAPCKMYYSYNAAVDHNTVYIRTGNCDIYAYLVSICTWSHLPSSPTYSCPFVVLDNLPTLIGGYCGGAITNQLFSLTDKGVGNERRWIEKFPPMPTNRYASAAVFTGIFLIVAGGKKEDQILPTIEVLDTESLQWATAASLPQPMSHAPAVVCGDRIYVTLSNDLYSCSVSALVRSNLQAVWHKLSSLPVADTVFVSTLGQLLIVGGQDLTGKPTTAVHMYNPITNSWEVISHMATPRSKCCAAILPNDQLVVVGGWTGSGKSVTDSVEIAVIDHQ